MIGRLSSRPIALALSFLIIACVALLIRNVRTIFRIVEPDEKHDFLKERLPPVLTSMGTIRIAYCTYPQLMRRGEPVLGGEYQAKKLGAVAFKDKHVELVKCLAVPEQLPKGVVADSMEGLELLGLLNVHMRFCSFGASSVVGAGLSGLAHLSNVHADVKSLDEAKDIVFVRDDGLVSVYVNPKQEVVGPLMIRMNREAWVESVPGVAVQFDTKLVGHSKSSITIYMPYAYESFGRSRWNGDDASRKFDRHQENFGKHDLFDLSESVTRSKTFSASKERRGKQYFIAMVNSNCARSMPKTMIRGLFGYAVHEITKKPVHNLGKCPNDPEGSIRAGLTLKEREAFHTRWPIGKGAPVSTQDLFKLHKFSIVFENNNVEGYATEKLVTAYNARSIPVYWGAGTKVFDIFNRKAFIYCDLPTNLTQLLDVHQFPQFVASVCDYGKRMNETIQACDTKVQDVFYERAMPYFRPCIRQIQILDSNDKVYEAMLSEPLANLNERGELTGVWNETRYAVALRRIFDALDYENGPNRLNQLVNLKFNLDKNSLGKPVMKDKMA